LYRFATLPPIGIRGLVAGLNERCPVQTVIFAVGWSSECLLELTQAFSLPRYAWLAIY
jgi:hypothetical protein